MANRIETSLLVKGLTADTYTLDVRGKTFVDGDIEINGNVNIVGTATTINTQTVQARDNKIDLNYSGSTSTAIGGGIEILSGRTDGSSVSLTIDTDRDWNSNTGLNITGRTSDSTTNGLTVKNSGGTDNLVVRNDGNVGIGTSSPTEKLDVRGQIIAGQTGNITSNDSPFYSVRNNTGAPNYYTGWQYAFEAGGGIWGIGMNYPNNEYQFLTNGGSTSKFVFGIGNPTSPNTKFIMDSSSGYFGANISIPDATIHAKGVDSSSSNYGLKVQDSGGTNNLVVKNDSTIIIGDSSEYLGSSIYFDRVNRKTYFNPNYANGSNINDIEINARYTKWGTNSAGVFGTQTEYAGLDVFDGYSTFKINKQAYNSYGTYTTLGVAWREGSGETPNTTDVGSFIYNRTINKDDIYDRTLNGVKIDTSLGSWTNTTGTSTNIGLNVTVGNADVNYAAIFSGGNVGIGTSTPSEKLEVSGKTKTINFQMTSGATSGYVLTSDASGNATWQQPQDLTNLSTGLTIHFSGKTIFNLPSSPASGNISGDTTNAKLGMIQKIYHQSSVEPTFPVTWKLVGEGVYFTNELNIIYAEYVEPTWIEYWIIQQQ